MTRVGLVAFSAALATVPSAPLAAADPGACTPVEVFHDDFSRYHYLAHRGVGLGAWANAICHLDAWVAFRVSACPAGRAATQDRP